jgi:hypothetical protein
MTTNQARRQAYRVARDLGNVSALQQSVRTGSASPLLKREIRRAVYRNTNKTLARDLRSFGI